MYQDNESSEFSRMPKRRKLSEDLAELAPEVQDIPSLIEIAQRKVEYQNLDSQTLWKILPELKKLNNMIGMEGLKTTMFYQIIYYLQNMHKKGQNEYLHTVITGPPGTGKTSVAEIIGNIYKIMLIILLNIIKCQLVTNVALVQLDMVMAKKLVIVHFYINLVLNLLNLTVMKIVI